MLSVWRNTLPNFHIPVRYGRFIGAGQFHLPFDQRFDAEGNRKPLPHPETPRFPNIYISQKEKGKIANKRPYKMTCEANKVYWWCTCGHSKSQPFCDGHHAKIQTNNTCKLHLENLANSRIRQFKPKKVIFDKQTVVYWCQCKQTKEPPFCDGSHTEQEVQDAIKF